MADFTALKTAIQNAIKQNGNEEITGNLLQEVLLAIVTTLGDGSINDLITALGSEATTRSNADTTLQQNIDAEAQARQLADSTLQGGINTVSAAITAINNAIDNGCVYAGIATPSSTPASGKVFYLALTAGTYSNYGGLEVPQGINILKNNGSTWSLDSFLGIDDAPTSSSNKLVKSGGVFNDIMTNGSAFDLSAYNNGTTYADLNAALTALNTLPAAYKRGGMSFKFVLTSDNKYVQYRLMSDSFNTTPANWQGVDDEPTAGSDNLVKSGGVKLQQEILKLVASLTNGKLLNGFDSSNVINGRLNTLDGYSIISEDNYVTSNTFAVVEGNKIYSLWWKNGSTVSTSLYCYICWYDKIGKFISGEKNTSSNILTSPQGAQFVRISCDSARVNTLEFVEGDEYQEYKGFGYVGTLSNNVSIPALNALAAIVGQNTAGLNKTIQTVENDSVNDLNDFASNAIGFFTKDATIANRPENNAFTVISFASRKDIVYGITQIAVVHSTGNYYIRTSNATWPGPVQTWTDWMLFNASINYLNKDTVYNLNDLEVNSISFFGSGASIGGNAKQNFPTNDAISVFCYSSLTGVNTDNKTYGIVQIATNLVNNHTYIRISNYNWTTSQQFWNDWKDLNAEDNYISFYEDNGISIPHKFYHTNRRPDIGISGLVGRQDIAVYDGNIVYLQQGSIMVNDADHIYTVNDGHGNNACFGKELHGIFPYLYCFPWDTNDKEIKVVNITENSASVVDTISLQGLEDVYHINGVIDEIDEKIYCFSTQSEDAQSTDNIIFSVHDIDGTLIERKEIFAIQSIQGMDFFNDKIYMVAGLGGQQSVYNNLFVFDKQGNVTGHSTEMSTDLGSHEIEGISIDKVTHKIYLASIYNLYY